MSKKLVAPDITDAVWSVDLDFPHLVIAKSLDIRICDTDFDGSDRQNDINAIFLAGSKRVAEAANITLQVLENMIEAHGDYGAGIVARELRAALIASGYREENGAQS